jgi:5'-deoxynucleotidase YfbR-like HD superfamily hydrolase
MIDNQLIHPEEAGDADGTSIEDTVQFLLFMDRLKTVCRQTPLVNGLRKERTAEHSWHVAIAALCLYKYSSDPIDLGRALQLAVVHDLPEALVGDTFVYGSQCDTRRSREEPAMLKLANMSGTHAGPDILEAWRDYEYEQSPEGRFIMAIDVLLPIFVNLAAGRRSSWFRNQVAASEVQKRVERVRPAMPLLADVAQQAIKDATAAGLLR